MGALQNALNKTIQEQFSIPRLGPVIIERRLTELGIHLTSRQKKHLKSQFARPGCTDLRLNLDRVQLANQILAKSRDADGKCAVDLGDVSSIVGDVAKNVSDIISNLIPILALDVSKRITRSLVRQSQRMLTTKRRESRSYESRLFRRWGAAFDGLETLIVIATEAGDEANCHLRTRQPQVLPHLVEVSTRLHARSCHVASEVLTLLKAGFSDGAHARWRCLHELAVVQFFISAKGEDVAEAYLLHETIDLCRAARLYQSHCTKLGYEPFPAEYMQELDAERQVLLGRYGPLYAEDHGWAAVALQKKHTTFRDIEEAVEMPHMRPFYKMASHNVHASPRGILFRLGLSESEQDMLLAGPSAHGMTDPGQGTAVSLLQATTPLLTLDPDLDRLVICNVLKNISEDVQLAFLEADE